MEYIDLDETESYYSLMVLTESRLYEHYRVLNNPLHSAMPLISISNNLYHDHKLLYDVANCVNNMILSLQTLQQSIETDRNEKIALFIVQNRHFLKPTCNYYSTTYAFVTSKEKINTFINLMTNVDGLIHEKRNLETICWPKAALNIVKMSKEELLTLSESNIIVIDLDITN